jgi:hypothetical protein
MDTLGHPFTAGESLVTKGPISAPDCLRAVARCMRRVQSENREFHEYERGVYRSIHLSSRGLQWRATCIVLPENGDRRTPREERLPALHARRNVLFS